ncbi:MAG: ABC transporter ATP-binding protein/permease [Lachnospiraceae bacterium]|nr:ABC transporter ATP-binding protein/permease [Lachnospiraceae bacterium]
MKKLTTYMRRYWWRYLIGVVSLVLAVVLDNLNPQVTRVVVDDVMVGGNMNVLLPCLGAFLVITLGRTVFQFTKEYNCDMAGASISRDIRNDLFKHVQKLSMGFFDGTNTGEIMSRLTGDIGNIWGGVGFIAMLMCEIILHTTLVVVNMVRLSPKLAIFPCIAIPICGFLAIFLEKKLDKVYEDISEERAKMNTVAEENISGTRTVKAFAREKFELDKFLSHNKKYYDLNMKQSKVMIKYYPLFQLVTKLLPLVTILIGGNMVIKDEISLGTLAAFISYCNYIGWPMEMIGWVSNEMAATFASWKKLKKLADEIPAITSPENPQILENVKGAITFENVSFSIKDKEILKDISFNLPEGKTLGIMGATGSGKSSIFTMLFRFYDPSSGRVLLDGTDVKELSLSQLRKSISQVSQDVFLFSDTVNENIKFGKKEDTSAEEIAEALKMASADFVEGLSDKGDTVIGERGVGLSGGQKQRLSIARALSKHSPVLVLDDSTSALDTETEHDIQKTLEKLTDTTKIIISHRISAVRHADEIIVLKDGAVAERGTHDELLAQKGLYFETYTAQYGAIA